MYVTLTYSGGSLGVLLLVIGQSAQLEVTTGAVWTLVYLFQNPNGNERHFSLLKSHEYSFAFIICVWISIFRRIWNWNLLLCGILKILSKHYVSFFLVDLFLSVCPSVCLSQLAWRETFQDCSAISLSLANLYLKKYQS